MLKRQQTKCTIASLIMAGFLAGVAHAAPLEEAAREGYRAPRFQLPDLEGTRHSLQQYRGQVVLLNFWASWCAPCITEMPDLQAVHESFDGLPFSVVAISEDGRIDEAQRFVEGKDFTFPILHDTGQDVSKDYMVRGLPATFLLDTEGVVIRRISGPRDWTSDEWMAQFRALLPEESSPGASTVEE